MPRFNIFWYFLYYNQSLRLKLFKLVFMSHRCDVGFPDACRTLEGDVLWNSLLMFVLTESKSTCTIII
jgi:hypothetical protein